MTINEATPIMERVVETLWEFPRGISLCGIGTGLTANGKRVADIQILEDIDLEKLAAMCGAAVTTKLVDEGTDPWIYKTADLGGNVRLVCWTQYYGKKEAAPGDSSTKDGGAAQ